MRLFAALSVCGVLVGVGSCLATVEGFDLCDNGFDDDGDGRIDCDDESCAFSEQCGDCGDGVRDDGEECDDGNNVDDDGCSARCVVENCEDPDGCGVSRPRPPCGDSVLQPDEECDDGNRDSNDGCDGLCLAERERCDPNVDPGANCFDEDGISGDGCSAGCRSEFCGDGIVQPTLNERCDDQAPGAAAIGCLGCQIPVCGNGRFEGLERCDDGNRRDGDGCSSRCQPE